MAGITLAQAQAQLSVWLDASLAVASGQAYTIGGRSLTRADLAKIQDSITYWNNWVVTLDGGRTGPSIRGGVPG